MTRPIAAPEHAASAGEPEGLTFAQAAQRLREHGPEPRPEDRPASGRGSLGEVRGARSLDARSELEAQWSAVRRNEFQTGEAMASTRIPFQVSIGLALLSCTGCTPEARVTARAANEFSRPEEHVQVSPRPDLSEMTYDVKACGHVARYTCAGSIGSMDNPMVCVREPLP